jgi:kynurenine formamidase
LDRAVVDPVTGLRFYDLTHEWGHHTPVFPGYGDIQIRREVTHARVGVLSQRIRTVMHTGTHVNAPVHLVQDGPGVGELPLDRFFGSGVVLGIEKGEWELIEPDDLAGAQPAVEAGDVVIINTGWHRRYADSQEYFGHGPGLSVRAARWLVERAVKLVGIDTATVDHPMATSLGPHRGGPLIRSLEARYRERLGRDPREDHPDWNPAHRLLLSNGIPTVENVGGDVDAVSGWRCAFHAYPWRWPEGDACIIRLVAIVDPSGEYRLASGSEEPLTP